MPDTSTENTQISDSLEPDVVVSPDILISPPSSFDAAWLAGIGIVRKTGHSWTGDLMSRSRNNPTNITYGYGSAPSVLITNSSEFKSEVLKRHSYGFSKTSTKTFTRSEAFNSGQLMTALHNYNYTLRVSWSSSARKYYYTATITDKYDFVWDLSYNTYGTNFRVALANNTAAYGQTMGYIKPFNITIQVSGYFDSGTIIAGYPVIAEDPGTLIEEFPGVFLDETNLDGELIPAEM